LAKSNPVLDARSPGEFGHAHFPGAFNLALFTNEERKVVGTAYKQQGRKQAIKIGLDYFGVKMRTMVEEVENISLTTSSNIMLVHCWRGGMRSEAIAWLLDLYGYKIYMLKGGYKKFRQYVVETFIQSFRFKILSGFTGSGKTSLLKELSLLGKATIDLEALAHHRGSAFGAINQLPQPSQEMFENSLALELRNVLNVDTWIEDESQRIGSVIVPAKLWEQMQHSPDYFIDVPFEIRLLNIKNDYGSLENEKLVDAVKRIQKRLGGLETKMVITYLLENNQTEGFRILLKYYDKCYLKSLINRHKNYPEQHIINSENGDLTEEVAILRKLTDVLQDKHI
jgi:tRNA 2-selenouridine synthase